MANDAGRRLFPTSWADLRDMAAMPLDQLPFAHRFARYFVVGGLAFLIDLAVFRAGTFYLGFHYLLAGTVSFFVATAFNYFLSIRFVFASGYHSKRREVALVYVVSAIGLLINLAALTALIELAQLDQLLASLGDALKVAQLHQLVAKAGASAMVLVWNFTARHLWVFPV